MSCNFYFHRNPSLEDQACDRIYRVGQQNDVTIHKWDIFLIKITILYGPCIGSYFSSRDKQKVSKYNRLQAVD